MATTDVGINVQLLQELRKRYPEIPEHIVTSHMKQHNNDRAKCIEILDTETPNYLFDTPLVSNMQDCSIGQIESRQRSDSASSGISSTSSCSISSASSAPYTNPNPSGMLYHGHPDNRSQTVATDLTQFMTQGRNIPVPNIKCDVYTGHNSNSRSVPPPPVAGSPNKPMSVRQIQVHHITSNQGQNAGMNNKSGQCIEIQISPRNNPQDLYRQNANMQGYAQQYRPPNSYSTSNWGKQAPSYNHGNSVNYGVNNYGSGSSQGHHTTDRYVLNRRPVPPLPTSQSQMSSSEGHSPAPTSLQFSSPTKQYVNSPTTPQHEKPGVGQQHSSHATIFLRTTSTGQLDRDRTPYSSASDYPHMHVSQSEPYLQTPSYGISPSSPQHMEYNSPLFIRLDNTEDNSVHSQHYNPYLPSDSGTTPPSATTVNSRYVGHDNSVATNLGGAVNPPSYVGKVYPANDFAGGASHNEGEQMYVHYPSFPNRCSIPGHPPVLVRTSSGDSDHMRVIPGAGGDERHVSRTQVVLPSGNMPDSNSVDSNASKVQRLSSGSMQEEAAYTTALLQFQKERMEKLKHDLESELRKLSKTRSEVNQMEKNMLERRKNRCYNSFPSVEDISSLREMNRRLQADIQVMTREVDMYNNGQTPLGVLDPLEQQNFYKHMNTGQRGSIYSRQPPQTPPEETPPPIPPRTPITHSTTIPPAPPPQPQQDSDGDGEQWNCSACTFLNHPALNKCECCEMPRMNVPPPITGTVRHSCSSELCYCHDK